MSKPLLKTLFGFIFLSLFFEFWFHDPAITTPSSTVLNHYLRILGNYFC